MASAYDVHNPKVYIKIRRRTPAEEERGFRSILNVNAEENSIVVTKGAVNATPQYFQCDKAYTPHHVDVIVYEEIAAPLVSYALLGYNTTLILYGQSGTGKTHLLSGTETVDEGIMPLIAWWAFKNVFNSPPEVSYALTVSFIEIYNEEVTDLLEIHPTKPLLVKETPQRGVFVENQTLHAVDSEESLLNLFKKGLSRRTKGPSVVHNSSSRSHVVFTIHIESRNKITEVSTGSKMQIVDLAGTDRPTRARVPHSRMEEDKYISSSLTALSSIVRGVIVENPNIAYRSTKLTHLLKDSIGGNCKTAMLGMVSEANVDYEQTITTLRFASRLRRVRNFPIFNYSQPKRLERYEAELYHLHSAMSELCMGSDNDDSSVDIYRDSLTAPYEEQKRDLLYQIIAIEKKVLVGGEVGQCGKTKIFEKNPNLNVAYKKLKETFLLMQTKRACLVTSVEEFEDAAGALDKSIEEIGKFLSQLDHMFNFRIDRYIQGLYDIILEMNRVHGMPSVSSQTN